MEEALASVQAQTCQDFELIVVDDGSTDSSRDILRKSTTPTKVIQQKNAGAPRARNKGLSVASGRYLSFLDADDWWAPDFLEKMSKALQQSGAAIAYCGWQNVGRSGGAGKPFIPFEPTSDDEKRAWLFENTRWPIHGAMVDREAVVHAGGFPTDRPTCEDFALWLKVGMQHALVRVPEVLAFYRHHGGSQVTADKGQIALDHYFTQHRYLDAHPEIKRELGIKRLRSLMLEPLSYRGLECYWDGDLDAAWRIFRILLKKRFFAKNNVKYVAPSVLPLSAFKNLVHRNRKQ